MNSPILLDLSNSLQEMLETFLRPDLLGALIATGMLWAGSALFIPQKQGKISTGRFGGWAERFSARRIADRQRQAALPHKVALKAGNVEIPHAQQSITISGAPDTGKTFSIIDPVIRSAIAQGFPILVYDFKGSQLETHIAWAASKGYEVYVLAPGQPYTNVCNPLDFLANENDSLMASQLAQVLQKNTQKTPQQEDFFDSAGTTLVEALMLLAKTTPYPDVLMASKILNLSDLPSRIAFAEKDGRISSWTAESFSQLLSSQGAEKQVAGIIVTAQRTFKKFTGRQLISSFCGKTSIPLDLKGKQLLILQVDIQKRDAVSPLLAAILHLLVTRNFAQRRTDPLIISLDELPTLYLPDLPKWINEFRSNGFVSLLGYQNFAQLQYIYGRELSRSLFAACGTKVFFNPKDRETAEEFSGYLGEREVRFYTRSHSYGTQGGKSRSEQYQRVPLLTTDQILKFDQGECVFINPGYKGGGEASIPLRLKVRLSEQELKIQDRSVELWETVRDRLIDRIHQQRQPLNLDQENEIRREMAERLFPLPDQPKDMDVDLNLETPFEVSDDDYDEALTDDDDYDEIAQ
jgi:type IV secretory pathway TraG/TraD family ATPase VirD4